MTIDVTRKMNAKDRRIWRRRRKFRGGHAVRCAMNRGKSCTCQSKDLQTWGVREKADVVLKG